jgi:5'(3')-deoxyribonucleotidase
MAYNKPRMAIDLDGVFADHHKFILEHFGKSYNELGGDYVWEHLTKDVPNLFYHLEPFDYSIELFDTIIKNYQHDYDIFFLTAIPKPTGYLLTAAEDKVKWVRKYLHDDIPVHCVLGKALKKEYVHSSNDILIDDHTLNISDWTNAGGIGILHTTPENTLVELEKWTK